MSQSWEDYDVTLRRLTVEMWYVYRIGVLYGFGSEEELLAAGAIHLVNTPQELVEYLGGLTKVTDAKAF